MTTYSAVANSEIAVGAPITNSLKTKERDNLLAIQENDASAPTIAYATSSGTIASQGNLATLNTVTATEIDAGAVDSSEIATDAVGHDELATAVGTDGTQTITASATWTPAAGFYNITQTAGASLGLEIFANSAWRTPSKEGINALVWFDGTNMRIKEFGTVSPGTLYWQKLG